MNPWGLPSRDERPHQPKNRPAKDRDILGEYANSHYWCGCCGSETNARQVHHIVGGRGGRSDEWCNLLMACFSPCHPFCDLASNLGVVLAFKIRADGLTLAELARLAALNGKALPDVEPIPESFAILWAKHRRA